MTTAPGARFAPGVGYGSGPVTHRRGHWQGSRRGLLGFAGAGGLLLLARGTRAFAGPPGIAARQPARRERRAAVRRRPAAARDRRQQGADRPDQLHARPARDGVARDPRDGPGRGVGAADEGRGRHAPTSRRVLAAGHHTLDWTPAPTLAPRTYIARISARSLDGKVETKQAVVRLLGVDAAFAERSAAPGTERRSSCARMRTRCRSRSCAAGPKRSRPTRTTRSRASAVGAPLAVDWSHNAGAPAAITVPVGADWPSGVYAAQITGDDGRRGFAPLDRATGRAARARRRRHADEHLGRLQLLRRRRRRLGRHVVRALAYQRGRPDSPPLDLRRPLPLPELRPRLPALARPDRQDRRHDERRGPRAVRDAGRPARRVRPDRLPRPHRVRDRARVTTSSRRSATTAAT